MAAKNEVTFGLVHGAWHGAWCWSLLQDELEDQGHKSVAMDLPIDDPDANFEDYADVLAGALKNEEEVVLVGHSRAGNVVPRAAGRLAVRKVIYLCSSFEPATVGHLSRHDDGSIPPRNSEKFQQGIIEIGNELTMFDRELAKELFFNDCPPDIKEWAVSRFRPQRRSANEPELVAWPKVRQEYIVCEEDLVINPDWSHHAAKHWLGIEPIELPGGHSPFLSRPKQLANLLISLAE